ncbi:fibroblast growth factor receptor 3-like [Branchiostoma lanceolatum]|uniref:fibroblast growth factor receptor 3-like n=1 Tax=Branchiostoma lanceolatum TaxID=7740 RepID=UPI003452259D
MVTSDSNESVVIFDKLQTNDEGIYTCTIITSTGEVMATTFVLNASCPVDRKGSLCTEVCGCDRAHCDRWTGCICGEGWTGSRCQTRCPDGTYGKGCARQCSCQNGVCRTSDGSCDCRDGWYGSDCSRPCVTGRYGRRCQNTCACRHNGSCSHVEGSCQCVGAWTGRYCDVKVMEGNGEPFVKTLVPIVFFLLLCPVVLLVLYKKGWLCCVTADDDEETQVLLELQRVEADLTQGLQPGWLGRWEKKAKNLQLGDLIGAGMFGEVRNAELRTPKGKIPVAAKSVRVEDAQSYRDFYREVAILIAVHEEKDHDVRRSNIVQLFGVMTKAAHKYIILEYAPKGDLLCFLRQQRNHATAHTHVTFLPYAVHIARALQELQRLRIVHRDVAARNVLVTRDNVAKLADFGLARDVYATTQYVSTPRQGDGVLLPVSWMALESLEMGEYTCQSDVWSFGVLLWEIASLGDEPRYDDRARLTGPVLIGILRRGVRLRKPARCDDGVYAVMRSCWRDDPETRPTPDSLERRLEHLHQILDPDFVIEMETVV